MIFNELKGVIILGGIVAWSFHLPLARVIAAGVPIKMMLDVFLERDTYLNLQFFDLDEGYIVKLGVVGATIYALEA